jgi:hypothetical protein
MAVAADKVRQEQVRKMIYQVMVEMLAVEMLAVQAFGMVAVVAVVPALPEQQEQILADKVEAAVQVELVLHHQLHLHYQFTSVQVVVVVERQATMLHPHLKQMVLVL